MVSTTTGESSPLVAKVSNYTASAYDDDSGYWPSYVPAVTVPLYESAAAALSMDMELKYPAGKLNITTESIVDATLSHVSLLGTSHVPLWIGIDNPFSGTIYLQETNFGVYWVPGTTPSGTNHVFGATPVGYVLNTGLDIEIPGNNATLTGTTAADALTLTVPHSDEATSMVLALR